MRKWARISAAAFVCDKDKERGGKKRQGIYKNAVT